MKVKYLLALLLVAAPVQAQDMGLIHQQVNKLAPIVGISGNPKEPAKIRIDFADSATPKEKQAARDYLKGLSADSAEIQPPDVEHFLADCLEAELFTDKELIEILYVERLKDSAKRDALILRLVVKAPPERQAKLLELASKHHIALPIK